MPLALIRLAERQAGLAGVALTMPDFASMEFMDANPCQTCGACCTSFRVSFYWGETDAAPGGFVPAQLTEAVPPHLCCMKGTASKPVRCAALVGEAGKWVACSIYPQRPSPCRDFNILEADGSPNPRCAALRAQLPGS